MLDRVVSCSTEQFSFQMCFESGDGSGTFFVAGDREFQTAAVASAVMLNALDWKLMGVWVWAFRHFFFLLSALMIGL